MTQDNIQILTPQKLAQDLATFAIDRTDLKEMLAAIPDNISVNRTTLEYELQLLKILSVGWAISFYMPSTDPNKVPVTELFWEAIREISNNISMLTETTTGKPLDYFEILKERLSAYVKIMQDNPGETKNPADVMGPAFAGMCNTPQDAFTTLIGTKMFTLTLGSVKEYLNAVKFEDTRIN